MSECADHRGEYGNAACLACLVQYWQSSYQREKDRAEAEVARLKKALDMLRRDYDLNNCRANKAEAEAKLADGWDTLYGGG